MKFALINGDRSEAQLGLIGKCPGCGQPVVPKCGILRVHHWAHKGVVSCDQWHTKETDWHRNWKNQFPSEWQEVPHKNSKNGEFHFADVKTIDNWVIEFQHSVISPEERESREDFYLNLIWVVDGSRRKGDQKQFFQVLGNLSWKLGVDKTNSDLKITLPEGSLLNEWVMSKAHVLFDFGEECLWWLHPKSCKNISYLTAIKRLDFIGLHRGAHHLENAFTNQANIFDEMLSKVALSQDGAPPWTLIPFEGHTEEVATKLKWLGRKRASNKS